MMKNFIPDLKEHKYTWTAYESSDESRFSNLVYDWLLESCWMILSYTIVSGLLNSSKICSIVFPLVSGTLLYMKIKKTNSSTTKGRKEYWWISNSFNKGKTNPTVKLENQFTIVDTETAADRGPWEKISATMNQGIEPGPEANAMM